MIERWDDVFAEGAIPRIDDLTKSPSELERREPGIEGAPAPAAEEAGGSEPSGADEGEGEEESEELETEQHLWLKVPAPKSELLLGKEGEYDGIRASTVDKFGAVADAESLLWGGSKTFIGAGTGVYLTAGYGGIGSSTEDPVEGYATGIEEATISKIEETVFGLEATMAAINTLSPLYFSGLASAKAGISFALKLVSGLSWIQRTARMKGKSAPEGTMVMAAKKEILLSTTDAQGSIAMATPWGFSAFAGKAAEMVGGVVAGVVGGLFADLRAGFSSEVQGFVDAGVVGGCKAELVARNRGGVAEILGETIEVGKIAAPGMRQVNTKSIEMEATDELSVHVGTAAHAHRLELDHHGAFDVHSDTGHYDHATSATVEGSTAAIVLDQTGATIRGAVVAAQPAHDVMGAALAAALAGRTASTDALEAARLVALGNPVGSIAAFFARREALDAIAETRRAARDAYMSAFSAILDADMLSSCIKAEADKITLSVGTCQLELDGSTGKVTVTCDPTTKLEMQAGKATLTAPLGLEVSAGAASFTLGPAGYQGPGVLELP